MPANPFNGSTEYGIGIGLRVPHYRHILAKKPVVDWFEIISENFMVDGGRPLEVLDSILEQYRVVQHGVASMDAIHTICCPCRTRSPLRDILRRRSARHATFSRYPSASKT